MSEEIFLEGKNYVSSKKAAVTSGYAQDYIGQLARSGAIDAQRVGGLWYVNMASLSDYQRNAASYAPVQPPKGAPELDAVVSFDGKEYVSAARGAKMTGYHQDYIGQLARAGKILSRQVGNRWYVEKSALTNHKSEKDRLLAAVQAEAVGLQRPEPVQTPLAAHREPLLAYFPEKHDLMPVLEAKKPAAPIESPVSVQQIPIRVVRAAAARSVPAQETRTEQARVELPRQTGRKTIFRAAEAGVALTFVLVLSYGLVSLKDGSVYAVGNSAGTSAIASSALVANASGAFDAFISYIETLIVPQLLYHRSD